MARPKQEIADVKALKSIIGQDLIDLRPLIALVMHYSGCSDREIGEVFGVTRQSANNIVKTAKEQ